MPFFAARWQSENNTLLMETNMTTITAIDNASDGRTMSPWITVLLAGACGLIVANLYYAQPLA
jgi:hypothetical protein